MLVRTDSVRSPRMVNMDNCDYLSVDMEADGAVIHANFGGGNTKVVLSRGLDAREAAQIFDVICDCWSNDAPVLDIENMRRRMFISHDRNL